MENHENPALPSTAIIGASEFKKDVLIVFDETQEDVAAAAERALGAILGGDKLAKGAFKDIQEKAAERDYLPPGFLIIFDTSDLSYTPGVRFLRNYWAGLLKNKKKSPPVIFISFDNLPDLIKRDLRHSVLSAKGIDFIPVPFSLEDIKRNIQANPNKIIDLQTMRDSLVQSCDFKLGGSKAHARKNYLGPYLLLLGARSLGGVPVGTIKTVRGKLPDRDAEEELGIFSATLEDELIAMLEEDRGAVMDSRQVAVQGVAPEGSILSEESSKRKILLIDDESQSSGWYETLSAIFGNNFTLDPIGGKPETQGLAVEKWRSFSDVIKDDKIVEVLASYPDRRLINYDLILLDLYLTPDEDGERSATGTQRAPDYSGLQLLKKIQKKDPTIPVILFTASEKADNVVAAKETGAEYFRKEDRWRSKVEVENYYKTFKSLVKTSLNWKKIAVRELYRGLEQFKATRPAPTEYALKPLESALSSLSKYLKNKEEYSDLKSAGISVGDAIKNLRLNSEGPENLFNALNPSPTTPTTGVPAQRSMKDIGCFLANQIRHCSAHPDAQMTFQDLYFAIFALLTGLDAQIVFKWEDGSAGWDIDSAAQKAKDIVDSICNSTGRRFSCPVYWSGAERRNKACFTLDDGVRTSCSASNSESHLKRAMYLSMYDQYRTHEALRNQAYFRYLFYILCLNELHKIDELNMSDPNYVPKFNNAFFQVVSPLIQSRLTSMPFRPGTPLK